MPRGKRSRGHGDRVIEFPSPGGSEKVSGHGPEISPALERILQRVILGKPFRSLPEANAFFDELRAELLQVFVSTAGEPDSAASLIAEARMDLEEEAVEQHLELAVHLARQQLPDDFFERPADPADMPAAAEDWLDAKVTLAERARLSGNHEDSVRHFEEIYQWAPDGDARESLMAAYLAVGNTEGARPLLDGLADGAMKWFAAALYEYLRGDLGAANTALLRAVKANRFLREYLASEREMPAAPGFSPKPGSRGEANRCMFRMVPAWAAHRQAVRWLEGHFGPEISRRLPE